MDLRILQVMAGAEQGGAELFFERLCIGLHKAGVHQHVITRPAPARIARMQEAGLRPVLLPFGGWLDLRTRLALRREIARFKPAVVLSWMNRAARFMPPGDYVLCARHGGYYDLKYYRHCDWLIFPNQDIRSHAITAGFPADRCALLPNFVPAQTMPAVARKGLYTPENAPLILSLGRLHENKAQDTLLRAVAQVPDVYVWLAGEGPMRPMLETLARDLGIKPRVRFLGWRDDTPALYAAADLVVFPSRVEAHGNVVLEAWAQGRPIIATATEGPARHITPDQDGILVPIDDPFALAGAIRRVLETPGLMEALAHNGWQRFLTGHTEERVVAAYRQFFETVAARGKAGTSPLGDAPTPTPPPTPASAAPPEAPAADSPAADGPASDSPASDSPAAG